MNVEELEPRLDAEVTIVPNHVTIWINKKPDYSSSWNKSATACSSSFQSSKDQESLTAIKCIKQRLFELTADREWESLITIDLNLHHLNKSTWWLSYTTALSHAFTLLCPEYQLCCHETVDRLL